MDSETLEHIATGNGSDNWQHLTYNISTYNFLCPDVNNNNKKNNIVKGK